jgi:hypothetical protein
MGTIHACYSKSGGALRVIDSSVTNCKSGETSLTWNQSGPTGPPAAQLWANFGRGLTRRLARALERRALRSHPSTGQYNVQFNTDVSACAPVTSRLGGFESDASTFAIPGSADTVEVLTTSGGALADRPFSIAVFC